MSGLDAGLRSCTWNTYGRHNEKKSVLPVPNESNLYAMLDYDSREFMSVAKGTLQFVHLHTRC